MANHDVDLSALLDKSSRYAVRCRSKADAEIFLRSVESQHPEALRNWLGGGSSTKWRGYDTIYTFAHKHGGTWYIDTLLHGRVSGAVSMGYNVIEFSEIHMEPDIDEAGASLDVLFG